jgi:hypothetical protein
MIMSIEMCAVKKERGVTSFNSDIMSAVCYYDNTAIVLLFAYTTKREQRCYCRCYCYFTAAALLTVSQARTTKDCCAQRREA